MNDLPAELIQREQAAALYAFAQQLEGEAAAYRRVLRGLDHTRSTTVETMLQTASMARQAAYAVERRGLAAAMRGLPTLPQGPHLERAIESARMEWFRTLYGRYPVPGEFDHRQGEVVRNAIAAAWPHLRAAAQEGEG
ncbi:hypothetical protein [Xanthomonas rydalmerensis]|uniref:DUF2383 domain-containing protein n=1 Tax=Xanthomonas rydalmerensis TaxID=3046274 RepID=A0ABZ0JNY4_9XANT|nr:hypothetical protein [Xanthomonas sp. DM-2023]WOS40694.1 hypothetical protein QN243_20250 [Xanthomonas sp. DM-2023]WOS44878.1 hypothetical protein QN242_20250 [Xanthomonas sp. DM-2023]WOS49058.1 hypothetical protein QN240_20250 [Xanthomonas sp. DM-2023]WOS53238.1 hypothetical protein QN244_20255 [Xanthomonas sp. DM-2023]WOS57421.1 hypothetical protein QN245_20250 [Xanthomonas sp. DM-2023]